MARLLIAGGLVAVVARVTQSLRFPRKA